MQKTRRKVIKGLFTSALGVGLLSGGYIAIAGGFKPLRLTEDEWAKKLSDEQYHILREEGTEPKFSSPLLNEKRKGTYVCAGCQLPLFKSEMKYDSGTGWPSFFDFIKGNLGTKEDNKFFMKRTEYHCARCGGHQGHVFADGPQPTGLRYCNNGLALEFVPDET